MTPHPQLPVVNLSPPIFSSGHPPIPPFRQAFNVILIVNAKQHHVHHEAGH